MMAPPTALARLWRRLALAGQPGRGRRRLVGLPANARQLLAVALATSPRGRRPVSGIPVLLRSLAVSTATRPSAVRARSAARVERDHGGSIGQPGRRRRVHLLLADEGLRHRREPGPGRRPPAALPAPPGRRAEIDGRTHPPAPRRSARPATTATLVRRALEHRSLQAVTWVRPSGRMMQKARTGTKAGVFRTAVALLQPVVGRRWAPPTSTGSSTPRPGNPRAGRRHRRHPQLQRGAPGPTEDHHGTLTCWPFTFRHPRSSAVVERASWRACTSTASRSRASPRSRPPPACWPPNRSGRGEAARDPRRWWRSRRGSLRWPARWRPEKACDVGRRGGRRWPLAAGDATDGWTIAPAARRLGGGRCSCRCSGGGRASPTRLGAGSSTPSAARRRTAGPARPTGSPPVGAVHLGDHGRQDDGRQRLLRVLVAHVVDDLSRPRFRSASSGTRVDSMSMARPSIGSVGDGVDAGPGRAPGPPGSAGTTRPRPSRHRGRPRSAPRGPSSARGPRGWRRRTGRLEEDGADAVVGHVVDVPRRPTAGGSSRVRS